MAWISGRTLRPVSGELVFLIDENAQLPGPQYWDQFWQVCEGLEPKIARTRFEYLDSAFQTDCHYERMTISLEPSESVLTVAGPDVRSSPPTADDVDPRRSCQSYTRRVTVSVVNFEITDEGDSVLVTKGCIGRNCAEISVALRTRGRNPGRSTLNGVLPNDMARAICWHESRWRHFLPNGKPLVNYNTNGTADWGLMQINRATVEQRWNWRSNLAQGLALLDDKRTQATRYLGRHPPYTSEMVENEMIQRYNGGTYYKWNVLTQMWVADPPNNYVATIRKVIGEKPWTAVVTTKRRAPRRTRTRAAGRLRRSTRH